MGLTDGHMVYGDDIPQTEEEKEYYCYSQRSENGWVPISERKPREGESVLVTVKWDDGVSTVEVTKRTDVNYWHGLGRGINVTAWMPVPKPYEQGGEK